MRRGTLLALIGIGAALATPVAAGAADKPYHHVAQATASGSGGAAATVDSVATDAAIDVLRRGGNAVDAAVAAAAVLGVTEPFSSGIGGGGFMVIRTPRGKVTTIDSREAAPAAMTKNSFIENGTPLPFNDARYSGLSGGAPGTVSGWDLALRRLRPLGSAPRPRARDPRGPQGLRHRPHVQRAGAGQRGVLRRPARLGGALPRPRRHGARRRDRPAQPRSRPRVRADRAARRQGLLPRTARAGTGRGRAAAGPRAGRRPRLAARAADRARPGGLPREDAQADARLLPRPRRVGHGTAVLRRLDRRRGAQHPRGRAGLGLAHAHAEVPLVPRGLALRVRRPRQVARRPELLRRAAARPALAVLRRPSAAR